jgi:hypothetical protein
VHHIVVRRLPAEVQETKAASLSGASKAMAYKGDDGYSKK